MKKILIVLFVFFFQLPAFLKIFLVITIDQMKKCVLFLATNLESTTL